MDAEFHPWKLGFNKLSFTLHTGLAVHHDTYVLVYPLSSHAVFPFEFPRQVNEVS